MHPVVSVPTVPQIHILLDTSHVGAVVLPAQDVAVPHLHTLFPESQVGAVVRLPLHDEAVPHIHVPD